MNLLKYTMDKQYISRVRSAFFWYLKGLVIKHLYKTPKAFSIEEQILIDKILTSIHLLKANYIKNSNLVGIKAKQRCDCFDCNRIAQYHYHGFDTPDGVYLCKHHMEERKLECDRLGIGIKHIDYYKLKRK